MMILRLLWLLLIARLSSLLLLLFVCLGAGRRRGEQYNGSFGDTEHWTRGRGKQYNRSFGDTEHWTTGGSNTTLGGFSVHPQAMPHLCGIDFLYVYGCVRSQKSR